MNWVHASVYVLFLLFPWDPTRLTCSTMCQDPPRHVWICGEFPRDFLPVFARVGLFLAWICWISCGCRDVVGGLVTAWLIPSVTDSHGKRKMETDQRGEVGRSQVCQGGKRDWEGCLQYSFSIIASSDRETKHNLDCGQSRNLSFGVKSRKTEETLEYLAQLFLNSLTQWS